MSERQIRKLQLDKNDSNSYFFPATHYKAVYGDSGKTLDQELGEMWRILKPMTISVSANPSLHNEEKEEKTGKITITVKEGNSSINHQTEVSRVEVISGGDILPDGIWEKTQSITRAYKFNKNTSGYQKRSITVRVILIDGTTLSGTAAISEIARSYVGFSQTKSVSEGLSTDGLIARQSTSLAGFNENINNVPAGSTFWILIPSDGNFVKADKLKITSSGFGVTVVLDGTIAKNGVSYNCYKNTSGVTEAEQTWNIKIE